MLLFKYLTDNNVNEIDIFINSHRDADYMRGIKKLNIKFNISKIWDSGVAGTTTDSSEYNDYMDLRRFTSSTELKSMTYYHWNINNFKLRVMNSENSDFDNANDQSIVIKLEYYGKSVMLCGDTSYKSWKDFIEEKYDDADLKSDILLASHHGSFSFFADSSDDVEYHISHLRKINPDITIISVGDNDNHPNDRAVKLYTQHSKGSDKGNKVFTTKDKGNMKLTLTKKGGWSLKPEK